LLRRLEGATNPSRCTSIYKLLLAEKILATYSRSSRTFLSGLMLAGAAFTLLRKMNKPAPFNFFGKTALITGGSRGLGLLMARELVKRGASVAILARDSEELSRAAADLRRHGGEVMAIPCDVIDRKQVESAVEQVREQLGRISVLINNAGWIGVGPMETLTLEDYRHSLDLHFWASLYTTLAVLPDMRSRHEGRIVNISSIGGKISVPHLLAYSTGKFAVAGFSEGLRSEVLRDNIYVTTVYPGLMRTGSPRNATFKGKHREEYAWFSISAALPPGSINAQRAAQQVIRACEKGDAELIISLPAKLAIKFHQLFPGASATILALANRMLPAPGGIGSQAALGKDSFSKVSPSWITTLNERAAEQNNEVA
jgi:short-subunit dehydrogenase